MRRFFSVTMRKVVLGALAAAHAFGYGRGRNGEEHALLAEGIFRERCIMSLVHNCAIAWLELQILTWEIEVLDCETTY
jgi:hypothetical protein